MTYGLGRRHGRGRSDRGSWPGNGPFRDLPPWERPGWIYGPGSCWTLGNRGRIGLGARILPEDELEVLKQQKDQLERRLTLLQETLGKIEERFKEIQKQGITIVWIEHIMMMMSEGADRVLVIAEGKRLQCGNPSEVMCSKDVLECYLGEEEY